MKKRMEASSPNGKVAETKFDPSTWARQPRLLARNDADSAAMIAALLMVLADIAIVVAVIVFDIALPGWEYIVLLAGTEAFLLISVWLWTYARALRKDTRSARQWTWKVEQQMNADLDGDGYVGPPSAEIEVRSRGKEPETMVIDLPPRSAPKAPILKGFGISAPDLVSFLFEARSRGLQERNWIGKGVDQHVLPSGQEVNQALFRQVLQALDKKGMAEKRSGRWELMVDPEQIARQLHPPTPSA